MLYEVITDLLTFPAQMLALVINGFRLGLRKNISRASLYASACLLVLIDSTSIVLSLLSIDNLNNRITSYNVCYTKLLRRWKD